MACRLLTLLALSTLAAAAGAIERPFPAPTGRLKWTRLFDGSSLKGWGVEGKARWSVEEGAITARQHETRRSESWLLSDAEFADFVLLVRFRITPGGNSGVFVRAPKVRGHPGRMGFEMQIDATDRRYPTGSILDMAEAPASLQRDGWNRAMICCIGDQLFTAVNGRVAVVAEPRRARSRRGRIGFQMHGGRENAETVVEFKDIYVAPVARPEPAPGDLRFERVKLDGGLSEGAAVIDADRNGRPDVVCGPSWYASPTWRRHPVRAVAEADGFAESFWELPLDVNGDGRTDIIAGGGNAPIEFWYENPGRAGPLWTPHDYLNRKAHIHGMILCDLDGDGRINDLMPNGNGAVTWIQIDPGREPRFTVRRIGSYGKVHGLGVGDLNRDGRDDIVTPQGWYECPQRPTTTRWRWRSEFKLKGTPGVPIHVVDINGDRAADLVYGDAHGYGLWWLEQKVVSERKSTWTPHLIDDTFSQIHSIAIGDLNGDRRPDIVTGKRWQAANGADPGGHEPSCLFWFEHDGTGRTWRRHLIDYNTGAGCGMGLRLHDLDNDKDLDIIAPGKGGLHIFLNQGR